MNDHQKKEVLWMLLALILYALVTWFIFYGRSVQKDYISSEYIKKSMRYHGIQVAECFNGTCYFVRNGKRCKL